MEKAMHSRPVPEEYETLSCSKKPRLEASPSSEDIEKYTIFTDSEYKLPLYLSQFAISVFNSEKKASYEKVNVVKTMKSVDVVKGKIYLVTFEASLPNRSNNAKTFQTNIFMSTFPLDPIAKLKINFVRMKPSGFDYNGEEDSEEMVFEAKEEGSVVAVSGFDVEDFKEELFDESDEEDNEENQSESDEEDNEEEQSESDEEDNEEKQSESDEVSDEFDEEENEEKLSEYEKDSEEKLAVRKTVGGKGPRQCSIDVKKSDVSESEVEGSEEDISESKRKIPKRSSLNEEEDNEEKLSKSDDKDTDRKLGQRKTVGGRIPITQRKSVGGKAPRIQLAFCGTWTYYDPPNKNVSTASLTELVYLSQLAICVYNMKEVTYYDNVKVLKAMQSPCAGRTYHITFKASLSEGNAITFQTKIWVCLPLPYHKIEIYFVRVKPSIKSNDITK